MAILFLATGRGGGWLSGRAQLLEIDQGEKQS